MPRGGRRPGAGRKTNAEIKTVRTLLDQVISQDRWEQLFQTLYSHARKGNMRAAELLISYRYGDANAELPPEKEPPIRFFIAHSPDPDDVYFEMKPGGAETPIAENDSDAFEALHDVPPNKILRGKKSSPPS